MRSFFLALALSALVASCAPYKKEVPTGASMSIDNVYANARYDHSKVKNVLILPVNNPMGLEAVKNRKDWLAMSTLRNFGKFNYFNLQYDKYFDEKFEEAIIDLNTQEVDRTMLGLIGEDYNANAVLQLSIDEYQPYYPMRIKAKAALIDVNTGARIWSFDHVFDTDDAGVINAMKRWWNSTIAGGETLKRFDHTRVRPTVFANFVFYMMAESYQRALIDNSRSINVAREHLYDKRQEIENLQSME